ncbi:SAC3/GANP domain-containing protein [Coniochaeta sp. PMI_546]|nr:SAC3/GANP domain-containing protein [Coniochaeta sp. PMI_546]
MMPAWPSVPNQGTQPSPPAFTYHPAPAYTPVQVRQSFAAPYPAPPPSYPVSQVTYGHSQVPAPVPQPAYPPAAAPASEEPAKKKIDWPDSVRYYVQRSFLPENLDPSVTRQDMEAKLKEIISHANETGVMHTINWDTMPLPQQIIKQERTQALISQVQALTTDPTWGTAPSAVPANQSRKRKSGNMSEDTDTGAAPWRTSTESRGLLQDRITQPTPDKRQSMDEPLSKKDSKFQKQLEKRQKRFDGGYKSTYRSPSPPPSDGPVVGTCTTLEKRYLRLTAPPVPSVVRPEYILKQTLQLLKKKWKQEQNYSYICDQFKSMRQDLTVQRIKNDFTVEVYEIHARIALEKGDLGEYNQCQTQLKALYQLGLKGNPIEFKAYRILYFIHTANRTALNDVLADLTTAEKKERAIKHALDVRSALALGNYHRFFQLYLDTPNMGGYLMDMFVDRERLAAFCNICKAYKPDVRLRFVTEELGFEGDQHAAQFIVDHVGESVLEERNGDIMFLTAKADKLQLFEPLRAAAFRRIDIKGQI